MRVTLSIISTISIRPIRRADIFTYNTVNWVGVVVSDCEWLVCVYSINSILSMESIRRTDILTYLSYRVWCGM